MKFGPLELLLSSLLLTGAGPSNGGSLAANSAEVQQLFDRMSTPPTPGGTREGLYASFIDGLVADGVWSLLDHISLFFAADTEGDTLLNLKGGSYNASRASSSGYATTAPILPMVPTRMKRAMPAVWPLSKRNSTTCSRSWDAPRFLKPCLSQYPTS